MEIDTKKLVIGMTLVFFLGVLFAVVNGIYTEDTNEQLPLIVYGISFLSILVGAFIVVMFQWKINAMQLERILKVLPKEERMLIKILLDNDDEIEQNKMVALSGYSKVKVSRTLSKLEQRGIIEKRPLGNTNLVLLQL